MNDLFMEKLIKLEIFLSNCGMFLPCRICGYAHIKVLIRVRTAIREMSGAWVRLYPKFPDLCVWQLFQYTLQVRCIFCTCVKNSLRYFVENEALLLGGPNHIRIRDRKNPYPHEVRKSRSHYMTV